MKDLDPTWPVFEERTDSDDEIVGNAIYDLYDSMPVVDRAGVEYSNFGRFLSNDDFYQGLNMVSVIKRESDGKLFGYFWFDDISKHGESYVQSNGDEYGLECDTDAEGFDWDRDYISYYVFVPVEPFPITAYKEST